MARRPDIEAILRVDTKQGERALRTIRDEVDKTGNAALGRFGALGQVLSSTSSKFALMAAPVAAGGGLLLGFARAAKQTSDSLLEMNGMAQRANVGFETFQELEYAAMQANVPVDALADGLYELNLRAAEYAQTGNGPAKEAFERLGLTPDQVKKQLEDPAAFLELIIDRVRTLDGATARFTLDEIFAGTAAEQFVKLLDQAEGQLRANREEAREIGVVMSEDLLETAREINQRWDEMSLIISSKVRGAVLTVADAMLDVIQRGATLNEQLDRMAAVNEDRANAISRRAARQGANRAGVVAEVERLDALTGDSATQQLLRYGNALGTLIDKVEGNSSFTPIVSDDDVNESSRSPDGGSSVRAAGRDAEAQAAKRQAEAIKRVVDGLRFELELLGKSDQEQRILIEQRRAGVDATSAQGEAIADLVMAIEAETAAIDARNERIEAGREAAEFLGDATKDAFMAAIPVIETGNAALNQFVNTLMRAALEALAFGSGPLGGLFGGGLSNLFRGGGAFPPAPAPFGGGGLFADGAAFSGGAVVPFAQGGVVSSPTMFPMAGSLTGLMGEAGPEAIMPLSRTADGRLGVEMVNAQFGSSAASGPVAVSIAFEGSGIRAIATDAAGQVVGEAISEYDRSVAPETARTAIRQGQRYGLA
ncbi:MAG: hypothetical protein AAGG69_00630 [Pseudomonadota bacterium]